MEVSKAENYVVSGSFVTSDSNDFAVVSLVELIGDEEKDILGNIILIRWHQSEEIRNLLEKDKSYLFYVGFSNVGVVGEPHWLYSQCRFKYN